MAEWTAHVLTAAGRRLQAKVEAGTTLALTKMKLGSGTETLDEVDNLIDLAAAETEIPISAASVSGEVCAVEGVLNTANLAHGFYCREWGVFADDPDEGEILYAILIDEKPDWIPANAPTELTITYRLNIAVANGTHITANIDLAGLVDVDMLNAATHALLRGTEYEAGDIVTSPTLRHGLVLEAQTGGRTGETLLDVSGLPCGGAIEDGTVTWQAKRHVLTAADDACHTADWMCRAISALAATLKDISGNLSVATLPLGISPDDPGSETAWIRPAEDIGAASDVSAEFRLGNGTILANPKGMVLSDGATYYVGGETAGLSLDDLMSGAALLPGQKPVTRANVDTLFAE